jgi:phosphatidate cytidylyltransferase
LKNLFIRTASGVVYLVIIISALFLGQLFFGALFLIITILALAEFYRLTGNTLNFSGRVTGIAVASAIYILSFLVASHTVRIRLLSLAAIVPVLLFVMTLHSRKPELVKNLSVTFLGIIYVMLPFALLNFLAFPASHGNEYTHRIVLGIFMLVWINDTGAYVFGTMLGRHRLFPRISPKKSWEGLTGGTLLTFIEAFWMATILGILSRTDWMILAFIVSVFGVYGDLTESLIKRNAGLKDSGSIMPGHGGVLDRFDSILLVVPIAFIYLIMKGM